MELDINMGTLILKVIFNDTICVNILYICCINLAHLRGPDSTISRMMSDEFI